MIKSNQAHSVVEVNMKVQGRIRIERIGPIQHSQWSGDISAERVFDFHSRDNFYSKGIFNISLRICV